MDSNKWSNGLQIGGNIGILIGLAFVAIQINQSTEFAKLDMRSRSFDSAMQFDLAMMGENPAEVWVKASNNPNDLTDEDLAILHHHINFWWNHRERNSIMSESGLLDATNYQASEGYVARQVFGGNSTARAWWANTEPYNTGEWTEVVDQILESSPNGFPELLEAMRRIED